MFTVALLQLKQNSDHEKNLKIGIDACVKAKEMGADLAVFPEMWNNGYSFPANDKFQLNWQKQAIAEEGEYFQKFIECAKKNKIAVALTYLKENKNGKPFNAVSIIDRHGDVILTYSKVHTCDFSSEKYLSSGGSFNVCNLNTGNETIKVGSMICYDREFPESARILMLKGAEIIIIPNACEFEINRKCQLRARAFENMTGCALVNYAEGKCKGKSVAFDGIAFTESVGEIDGSSRDMQIVEAGEKECIVLARFDMDRLRRYRNKEVWGNAYRKPDKYKEMIDESVTMPFVRKNSGRK
jgi:predicted amidohydrolase